ncbi:MAG: tRNA (adenosine(37)-N6)-threonylcarbamoyltransferase complex ATPase subunit type 1 TsaE [Puniceicoccales bacterium]|jgi:tRNA threonylcarbamoyladenosine biosynthesis protein TsaE|nr:tRNA (adenosine(37)-N6)-threonylcarbamoyltransferase complex ATPase subunit type 1 TsaE [Puniceicoccales bacterium]
MKNSAAANTLAAFHAGILSRSPAATAALAAALARLLPPDTALALHGDLGAGKTAFAQGFAAALGVTAIVTSPTYAIFSIYEAPARQLVHMDAYRLNSPADADSLLLWDILRSPWTLLVEWPEKLGDRLPDGTWHLHFEILDDTSRRLYLRREADCHCPPATP